MKVKVNGEFVDCEGYVLDGGVWVRASGCHAISGGTWKDGICGDPDPGYLQFTQHPTNANGDIAGTVAFTVTCLNYTALQWQENDGGGWADITGETGSTYTHTIGAGDDQHQYRCEATDGTSTIYSNVATLTIGACTPLTGPAAGFLAVPTEYTRDGLDMDTLAAADAGGVFPDGPKPYICAFGPISGGQLTSMANAGFTVTYGSYGTMPTLAQVGEVSDAGLKMIYMMRNIELPFVPGSASGDRHLYAQAGIAGVGSSEMNTIEQAHMDAVDYLAADTTAKNTIIGFATNYDDALSNDPHDGEARVNYWKSAEHLIPHLSEYAEAEFGKPLHTSDLPGTNVDYDNFNMLDYVQQNPALRAGWMEEYSLWSGQRYWGNAGDISTSADTWWSRAYLWHYATLYKKVADDIDGNGGTTAPINGKHRLHGPLIWSHDDYSQAVVPEFRNKTFWKMDVRSNVLINLLAGSTMTTIYQFHSTYTDQPSWYEVLSPLASNGVFEALLWGEEKAGNSHWPVSGDMAKVIVDDPTGQYVLQDCLSGWYENCEDDEVGTGTTKTRSMDMILWKSIQMRDKRFLIVTNMQKHPAEHAYYDTTGPVPANYTITSKFTFPASMIGVKCTEITGGSDVDTSTGEITCTLLPVGSAIYVFEPADGYCSVGIGSNLPTVSAIVPSPNPPVYGDPMTLTITVSDTESWVWQADKGDGLGFTEVGQANDLIYDIWSVDVEIGWVYRVVATNTNGDTVSSTYTVPDVSTGSGGLTINNSTWKFDGNHKLLAGACVIGEPHLLQMQYDSGGLRVMDSSPWLNGYLTDLANAGVNFFRCTLATWDPDYTLSSDDPAYGYRNYFLRTYPFTGNHTNGFNLDTINQDHFDRLDAMLALCRERNIVVSVEAWDPHYLMFYDTWWAQCEWNRDNVASPSGYVNYSALSTSTQTTNNQFTAAARAGSYTVTAAAESDALLKAQKLYMDAVCTVLLKHDNCLLQIENESFEPIEWDNFWKNYADHHHSGLKIATMRDNHNLYSTGDDGARYSMLNAGYDYGDGSQGTYNDDPLDSVFNALIAFGDSAVKPVNTVKVYSRAGEGTNGEHDKAVDSFCTGLMACNAGMAFHPGSDAADRAGLGSDPKALNAVAGARITDNVCTMAEMSPVSISDARWISRPANKAYAAANGNFIAIYIVGQQDSLTFDTSGMGATMTYMWVGVDALGVLYVSSSEISTGNTKTSTLNEPTTGRRILIMSSTDLSLLDTWGSSLLDASGLKILGG